MLRRLAAGAILACAALVSVAVPASADYGPDCDDFSSSQEAQDYYESQGGLAAGDPDGLDRDQDGRACDWGAPPPDVHRSDSDSDGYSPSNDGARLYRTDDSGLPWWAWAGGGIAALWVIGLIRWNT